MEERNYPSMSPTRETKLADRQREPIEGSRKHVKARHVSDTITTDYEFKVEPRLSIRYRTWLLITYESRLLIRVPSRLFEVGYWFKQRSYVRVFNAARICLELSNKIYIRHKKYQIEWNIKFIYLHWKMGNCGSYSFL